ncbi:hypothetical protein [Bradyrhizobium macuxiense]|uniref:hypothetical protein n=1 Tax=Bradyrhizobium macuxiense TaxID=1755647 RepID=UPI001FDA2C6B|nr:hypothetical protein [Bradyrhizobium macuxiense]
MKHVREQRSFERPDPLLLALRLLELGCIQSKVCDRLLIRLSGRLELLALLELLHGAFGFVAPASVRGACLETVLVEGLLNLPDFASRRRLDRLVVLSRLLLAILLILLMLPVLGVLLVLLLVRLHLPCPCC